MTMWLDFNKQYAYMNIKYHGTSSKVIFNFLKIENKKQKAKTCTSTQRVIILQLEGVHTNKIQWHVQGSRL